MPRIAGADPVLALTTLLALAAFAGPARAQFGEMKTFRDWTAACDNTRACAAVSLPQMQEDPVAWLRLDRPAGADGGVALALRLRSDGPTRPAAANLLLDGAPFPAAGRSWPVAGAEGETGEIRLPAADAEALIAAARQAKTLSVRLGRREAKVSLAGSVAAMLWIDERQGRLNTGSALIRKGPGAGVPAAPPVPAVAIRPIAALPEAQAAALIRALRAELKRRDSDACEDTGIAGTDAAWSLDERTRLVGLACSLGAYNLTTGFWLVAGKDVSGARPAAFPQAGGKPAHELVNAEVEPATGRIGFFAKGRGLGDCGAAGSYGWTGSAFAPLAFSAMDECRGIGPDDWLTLYRSTAE